MSIPAIPVILVAGVAVGAASFQIISISVLVLVLLLCGAIMTCFIVGQRSVHFLGQDEQLLVEGFTGMYVQNGPGTFILNPFTHRSASVRKAETLGTMDYLKVRHAVEGKERIEKGPQLFFLAPYEQIVERSKGLSLGSTEYALIKDLLTGERRIIKGPCMWFPGPHEDAQRGAAVSLSRTEYLIVEDQLTGEKATVKGPTVWFPGPFERSGSKMTAIALQDDEYIKVKDTSSGKKWVQQGKALVFPEPTWQVEGGVRQAWALKSYEYVRLVNKVTGKVESHRGEQTVFPGPDDELLDGQVMQLIDLKVHEYVKILDQSTGAIRVESGSQGSSKQVFLGPHDKVLDNGKKKAVEIDGEHAVLVRDKSSGQVRLVTEKQLFIPGPNESIEKVQDLIKLADHEALIVKNKDGEFQYFYGSDENRAAGQPRSFFLEPYAEIVKLCWSKGRRRETRNLFIERFDCRAQFMSFEFNCRTSDNVELILEGTFFWEVVDLPAMVKSTGDTSGDLCNHARSQFIRHVARVTLKEFMDSSHAIAKKVWEEDTSFYASRGVKIHSLEVTRYQCADSRTSEILEQIIQETTNRMNRLSQAESENEVSLFRTHGQIEQERLNGDLLAIKHKHSEAEAEVVGRAEANKVAASGGARALGPPAMLYPWFLCPMVPMALARRLDGPATTTTMPRPGAAEVCFEACKAQGFCCNDYNIGSNQHISCAQACMMRFRGQTEGYLQELCLERTGCVMTIDSFEYGFCSSCLDLTDSPQCRWGATDASACQMGAQLKLCQQDLAGQVVTLFDVSRKAFLAIGDASSGSGYAEMKWVDDFSEAAAHWRMEVADQRGWIFSSVYGPTNAPSSNWRLSGCEMLDVSDSDQILDTNYFLLETPLGIPVLYQASSSGVFVIRGYHCDLSERRLIIEAYPRNFSLCPEAEWANSISTSLRNNVLSGFLLVLLAFGGQVP